MRSKTEAFDNYISSFEGYERVEYIREEQMHQILRLEVESITLGYRSADEVGC